MPRTLAAGRYVHRPPAVVDRDQRRRCRSCISSARDSRTGADHRRPRTRASDRLSSKASARAPLRPPRDRKGRYRTASQLPKSHVVRRPRPARRTPIRRGDPPRGRQDRGALRVPEHRPSTTRERHEPLRRHRRAIVVGRDRHRSGRPCERSCGGQTSVPQMQLSVAHAVHCLDMISLPTIHRNLSRPCVSTRVFGSLPRSERATATPDDPGGAPARTAHAHGAANGHDDPRRGRFA